MTLPDTTVVVHSEPKADGTVKVYIEKPIIGSFHNATCFLPEQKWCNIEGFNDTEMMALKDFVNENASKIMESAVRKCVTNDYVKR